NDTIHHITIVQKSELTNEDQVTFIGDETPITLDASSVTAYFDGKQKYISTRISSDRSFKLMNYQVIGYLQFAQSSTSGGDPVYYYIFDGRCVNLSVYMNNIEKFVADFIPDYEEFKDIYHKKMFYDFKSLAEFASAYNAYRYPDKYVFEKYQNKEAFSTGSIISLNFGTLNLEDFKSIYISGLDMGLNIEYKYSPNSSLMIQPYFSHFAGSNTTTKVKLNAMKLKIIIAFTFYTHRYLKLQAGPGIGFYYNLNSIMNRSDTLPYNKKKIEFRTPGINYNFNILAVLNERHKIYVLAGSTGIKTKETTIYPMPNSEKKGRNLEFGIGYGFNF
ncbi:MAG TPA: hypothetical protein VE912_13270, partial [Bacteroidales bacterium]|nr:hypothetical protein [Bacteroidales bacterium]